MHRPRTIFDTHLYLNFLLSRTRIGTAVDVALDAAAEGKIELFLPDDVVTELATTIARRPHLASRIQGSDVALLMQRLLEFATPAPALEEIPPAISHDPRDDYLLALAVLHRADYIVTRDKDLLDLGEVAGVRIVDPVTFLAVLRVETEEG